MGQDPIWAAVLPQVAMMALSAVAGWLGGRIRGASKERQERQRQSTEERDRMRAAMRDLLFYRLTELHQRYVVDGEPCPPAEKQAAEDIYRHYHEGFGGNGAGTQMYREIMAAHVAR